jgi:hypothetical protein
MTLRRRLGMLKGIYAPAMPYRAPHTAGPALWALLQGADVSFEVSVAIVEGVDQWRKGVEALAISLYRQEWGRSPTVNFGRMPPGYRASSSNDARLVRLGKRFRGGPCVESDDSHAPGIPPAGTLDGDPQDPSWCGHAWSAWRPVTGPELPGATAEGLYRLRAPAQNGLLYVGQGKIAFRLAAHLNKCRRPGHCQGALFGTPNGMDCSWVLSASWLPHQRLELENDLIAAHLVVTGKVPAAQFLGERTEGEVPSSRTSLSDTV